MLPDEHELSYRPTYTRDQLALYVSCIAPDPSYTLSTLEAEIKADPLAALSTLQLRQMAFNPWGNVALHYSWHRTLSLDPEALFHKIVERKLGGYCMENNAFFSTILRSLGYQLYVTGARISYSLEGGANPHGFAGWQHEVILVTINGQKYLADVGFGSQPLIDAIPLVKPTAPDFSDARVYPSVPGAECRLVYRAIAPNTDPTQRLWVFETRNASKPEWAAGYCFNELEWLPGDFEIINYRTSMDPSSWFTHRLVLAKILVDEKRLKPTGTVTLNGGKIERRLGADYGGKGGKEVVVDAKTEKDRIVGLRTWFNVVLHPDEERGIKGMASEIAEPFQVSTDA